MLPPEIQNAVDTELTDPRFKNRTHYHRKTYDAGCRGPLCSQAKSERAAARYASQIGRPPRKNSRTVRRAELAPALVAYLAHLNETRAS